MIIGYINKWRHDNKGWYMTSIHQSNNTGNMLSAESNHTMGYLSLSFLFAVTDAHQMVGLGINTAQSVHPQN